MFGHTHLGLVLCTVACIHYSIYVIPVEERKKFVFWLKQTGVVQCHILPWIVYVFWEPYVPGHGYIC